MFLLLAIIIAAVPLMAQEELCKNPDTLPELFGGVDKYVKEHFKYPKEAYKEWNRKTDAVLEFTITKRGKVKDFRCPTCKHPALAKELKRVFEESTWYPATKIENLLMSNIL